MGAFFGRKVDFGRKAVTLSKHWPGAYELRVGAPQKGHFFAQVGVKKATNNEEGKKRGHRGEKERKIVPKREPKAVKNGVKNEAQKRTGKKRQTKNRPGTVRGPAAEAWPPKASL